jgi:pimeloyl-ACP methyl ester carboxylesterase
MNNSGIASVNGIDMYYEIHGAGDPLVLIHGGGSTIQSTWGRIMPMLAITHTIIAMDLQNHGRSGFRKEPQTFEQDADDVAALMDYLEISNADIFGFSNGGMTAMEIYFRHPQKVKKLILASSPYSRETFFPGFFDMMKGASLDNMPVLLKEDFLAVNPDPDKLQLMFEKDRDRMIAFEGWSDDQLKSIDAPALLIAGDRDVIPVEGSAKMSQLIKNSRVLIVPGTHGDYIGEVTGAVNSPGEIFIVPLIERFLKES